jgi:hypothetical protein
MSLNLSSYVEVEHKHQTKDDDCGPTCISMVSGIPIMKLLKEIRIFDRGTYSFQLAGYLHELGMKPECYYFNPKLTHINDQHDDLVIGNTGETLITRLLHMKPKCADEKNAINFMHNYLKYKGGHIEVCFPTLDLFLQKLDKGYIALCLLINNHIYEDDTWERVDAKLFYHFNIVSGYTKHSRRTSSNALTFTVQDPMCDDAIEVNADHLLYGINSAVGSGAVDFGNIIFVKPRR